MDDPLVRALNVSRRFQAGVAGAEALHEASCAVHAGDRIALMGPSGSGKSTLLHLLGGLDLPTSGEISWPALGPRDSLRPGLIADIFQGPSLLTPLTVIENVRLPLLLQDASDRQATDSALAALRPFGVAHVSDKLPEEISGGQAQRVAIARAIAVRPRLILADEPTGQLDSATAEDVLTKLLTVVADMTAAIVVSTHDPRVAEHFPIIWQMRGGRLDTSATSPPLHVRAAQEPKLAVV